MQNAWESTWDDTKQLYREYVNPDPKIDLKKTDDIEDENQKLARLIMPVDLWVESLIRYMANKDIFPEDTWIEGLTSSYPWISGVTVVDTNGTELAGKTLMPLKPVDVAPLLAYGDAWTDRRIRAHYEMTPLGPEIYLGEPFFKENVMAGLIVVHFDLAPLVRFCPNPDELIIMTSEDYLWTGKHDPASLSLKNQPWPELLKEKVYGVIENEDGDPTFAWVARYLGEFRIIYASSVD